MSNKPRIRVLLADPDSRVRAEMRAILQREADLTLVGQAEQGTCLSELADRCEPDVVISALSFNGSSSLAAAGTHRNGARVLVTSVYGDSRYAGRAFDAGARGYLLKDHAAEELAVAVRAVAANKIYVSPAVGNTERPIRTQRRPASAGGPLNGAPSSQTPQKQQS